MKKIIFGTLALLLLGAGCTNTSQPSTTSSSVPDQEKSQDGEDIVWKMYRDTNVDFDIQFEYPEGYTVLPGGTDTFFGYDIAKEGSDTAKIRIIMTRDNNAADLFINSVKGTETLNSVFEQYATIAENPLYQTSGEVHFGATGGLDSQGISIFILDEEPTDDLRIANHVFETTSVVNKK